MIPYWILKLFVRHGMVGEKVHEITSYIQSRGLEKFISFKTQKRTQAVNEFEKHFHNLINGAFIENRVKIYFIEKDDYDNVIQQKPKLTFNGIHKSYENYDSYTFEQNEVLMGKPIYLGFAILELSKFLMYETYIDKLQPFFGEENLQLHYMDTDSFVINVNIKDIIK